MAATEVGISFVRKKPNTIKQEAPSWGI